MSYSNTRIMPERLVMLFLFYLADITMLIAPVYFGSIIYTITKNLHSGGIRIGSYLMVGSGLNFIDLSSVLNILYSTQAFQIKDGKRPYPYNPPFHLWRFILQEHFNIFF
jgi:hypothetical protein